MGYGKPDIIEQKLCEEIKLIEKKYENKAGELDEADVKKLDLLYHALKSKATYDAMKDAEEYGYDPNQMSGRRGYSGYNNSRMSGHYPEGPDYYSGNWMGPPRWEPGPRW